MASRKAIIVDLDGTLCNIDHRLHFLQKEKKDWHQFHQSCENDTVEPWCQQIIESMKQSSFTIVLMTGRDDGYEDITKSWLTKNKIPYDLLLMRKSGDHRADHTIKWELFCEHLKNNYEIEFVLEDRKSVVEMWREKGLRCLQCAPGDF